jgi:hypothetical protein
MNYCLNRETKLYYIEEPKFEKLKEGTLEESNYKCLTPNEFLAF